MSSNVQTSEEWVLGPENTPFYTKTWSPSEAAKAHLIFVHEHVNRYNEFFTVLASPPYNLRIFGWDQRGSGRTSFRPSHTQTTKVIPAELHESEKALEVKVAEWKKEGKKVSFEPKSSTWRVSGGWAKVMPDMEWFVRREAELAKKEGKKLFVYAHSMTLGFVTRHMGSVPSKETISDIAGVIASGPLIRQTHPAGAKVAMGSIAAKFTPNMIIPAPLNPDHLSHNSPKNQMTVDDPLCEDKGTLRGLADMLNYGMALDSKKVWDSWPKDVPLCVYVADEDQICDPKAGQRFGEGVQGATFRSFKGAYHEVHFELEPYPQELAKFVGDWVDAQLGVAPTSTAGAAEAQPGSKL